jgi:MFS family permease
MIAGATKSVSEGAPPLLPALIAMMVLQAMVAMALFAPGILAPKLGLTEAGVSLFATGCFLVGIISAAFGGPIVGKLGSLGVASACMLAVLASMAVAALAGTGLAGLALAGLLLGLAFGPETPASSALLGRLVPPARRPIVFSIRQTGNQVGAILASLMLPVLAVADPRLGYAMIARLALLALFGFLWIRERYDPITRMPGQRLSLTASLRLIRENAGIRMLTFASVPLSAMQLTLNAFLVLFLTSALGMSHVQSGVMLAIAQSGGLIGRLGWGFVAVRAGTTHGLVAILALAMAAFAILLAQFTATTPSWLVSAAAFGLGLTASGWNGIFLAEVARQAPEGRLAEATGAVLTASYLGLVAGPVIVSALAAYSGLGFAFSVLGACCAMAGLLILWDSPARKRS